MFEILETPHRPHELVNMSNLICIINSNVVRGQWWWKSMLLYVLDAAKRKQT